MKDKQFDQFWEIKCPKCKSSIDIEILLNRMIANSENEKKVKTRKRIKKS